MKVELFTSGGTPCGYRDIPDDVVGAAATVRAWLDCQPDANTITLHGLTIARNGPPLSPEAKERIRAKLIESLAAQGIRLDVPD